MIKLSLVATLVLTGCSVGSLDLSQERVIYVERSPYRVVLSGDVTYLDRVWITQTLEQLMSTKYVDHNFTSVDVRIIDEEKMIHETIYSDTSLDVNNNRVQPNKLGNE